AVDDHGVVVQAVRRVAGEAGAWVGCGDPPGGAVDRVLRLDPTEVLLVPFGELRIQQRPHEHVTARVADHGGVDGCGEAAQELVVDRLVHDGRPQRRTPLPGRAESGEQRT